MAEEPASEPLFLAGADRSGIGLLGDVLDRHPQVAISRRINFWTFYDRRYGPLERTDNLDRCLEDLWRFRRVTDLGVDRAELRSRFLAGGEPTYGRLFALIGASHARARGKRVWGDKSLNAERHAARIFELFPDARMVHVVRDPRDRHLSVLGHRGGKRAGVYGTTAVWRDSARRAEVNRNRYRHRYLVVRYEDLVTDPAGILSSVCRLAGVDYRPDMLVDPSREGSGGDFFHTRSVGRYRREMAPATAAVIQGLAGPGMRALGYPLDAFDQAAIDRVRVTVATRILGPALMRAWVPWSKAKMRLSPGPASRRLQEGAR